MVSIQYDGHVALVDGLMQPPRITAPFDVARTHEYERGGLPMTLEPDGLVYLYKEVTPGTYLIPTGLLPQLLVSPYCDRKTIRRVTETATGDPAWVPSSDLRHYQVKATNIALKRKRGVISVPTGGGKSRIITELVRALGDTPILITVPTKLLLYQMVEDLEGAGTATDLREGYDVGLIGDGHLDIGKRVTVAIPDTLYSRRGDPLLTAWLASIPVLVCDECHTLACPTGVVVSSMLRGTQYRVGLSATPCMDNLLVGMLGELLYEVPEQQLIAEGYIMAPRVEVVTAPSVTVPARLHRWYASVRQRGGFDHRLYQELYSHCILRNDARNELIADIAKDYVDRQEGPLIIVVARIEDEEAGVDKDGNATPGKVSHASILAPLLLARGLRYRVLSGTTPKAGRVEIVKGLGDGSIGLVIAGASILKEGVNVIAATGTIIAGGGRGGKARPTLYILSDSSHTYFSNQSKTLVEACIKTYGTHNVGAYRGIVQA